MLGLRSKARKETESRRHIHSLDVETVKYIILTKSCPMSKKTKIKIRVEMRDLMAVEMYNNETSTIKAHQCERKAAVRMKPPLTARVN